MSLTVDCPQCGKRYKVKDELAGKAIRCKECQATIRIPAAETDDEFSYDPSEMEADEPQDELPPSRSKSKPAPKPVAKKKRASSGSSAWKWVLGILGGFALVGVLCCGGAIWMGTRAVSQLTAGVPVPEGKSFSEWRAGFHTKLLRAGPSTQPYDPTETPPENVTEINYPSGELKLKAWVYRPPGVEEPRPALVYFHGGFAFGGEDLIESCAPFIDAGFVVMGPMLRGENGNPGNFELFFGEVDDARAACQWLAQQPYVNKDRIYTFGHSIGGGVSAVLSMLDKVPIQHGGSSGGLYNHLTFIGWNLEGTVPFQNTPEERSVRLLIGNTSHMQHKHYAFIGTEDDAFDDAVEKIQKEAGAAGKLFVERMPGDHFDSFEPSIRKYLQIVQQDGL
jgi:dienelactone hydrolase